MSEHCWILDKMLFPTSLCVVDHKKGLHSVQEGTDGSSSEAQKQWCLEDTLGFDSPDRFTEQPTVTPMGGHRVGIPL